jgi:hypothetical protein
VEFSVMAWQVLGDGDDTAFAPKIANSVGLSLDTLLDKALSEGRELESAINGMRNQLTTDIGALYSAFAGVFAPQNIPSAPSTTTKPGAPDLAPVLDAAAYSGAFSLAHNANLLEQQQALWDSEQGAAANGVGLPTPAKQAMAMRARQLRRQATSRIAAEQAQLQAAHVRDDMKWAYEQRLNHWIEENRTTLAQFAAHIQRLQTHLASEAQRLQWESAKDASERSLMELALKISQDALLAYVGARAEYAKSLFATVSYSASTSGGGSWSNSYSYSESCSKDDC